MYDAWFCFIYLIIYYMFFIIGHYLLAGATADWWSVGIILFELLVGIPPFNADTPQVGHPNLMNGFGQQTEFGYSPF